MRKLMWFVLGFAAACALLVYAFAGVSLLIPVVSAVLTAVCFFLPKRVFRRLAAVLLGFTVGALWCTGYTKLTAPDPGFLEEPMPFTASAVTGSENTAYGSSVEILLKLRGRSHRAVLYTSWRQDVRPGDVITGTAKFQTTALRLAEGDDLYHRADGVTLTGSVREEIAVSRPGRVSLSSAMALFALRLRENLHRVFPASSAGYFTALVTGDRSGLSYDFRNRMSICGLYHAVSLSGMHVSVLMGLILLLCGRRRRLAGCLGIPVLVLFVLLSGARPATVRAAVMYAVLLFASFTRREYDPLTALSAALLPLLLHNPWCVAQWGLQLSFLSTAGILLLYPPMFANVTRWRIGPPRMKKFVTALTAPVLVSLSATTLSLPLMAAYFGLVSLIAPVTNLLALWSVMASFVGGIFTALLAFLPLPVASWLGSALHWLYRYLELVLELFSNLPMAFADGNRPILFAWAFLWYGLLTVWLLFQPRWYVPLTCAVVSLSLSLGMTALQTEPDGFTLLDVGQGQSIVCARGEFAYLIDCGGRLEETGEIAARFLRSRGRKRLDGVILTHFDSDHVAGVGHLLERMDVAAVYCPAAEESENRTAVFAAAKEKGVPVHEVISPVCLPLSGGAVTLYPVAGEEKNHESGLCILASGEECDILVTGDLPQTGELRLLADFDLPDLEFLVAGHHGSGNSTGRPILEALLPETVLISVGENAYGHPAPAALERIRALGAKAYTTKQNGNLTIGW